MYEISPRPITTEEILTKVTQEDIWEYYLGFPITTGQLFLSPLREEDDPSANLFYAKDGTLLLKDFGFKTMNVWQFVQYIHNLTFNEAVLKVSADLSLDSADKLEEPRQKRALKRKDRVLIEIRVKRWNDETLKYWASYGITKETLKLFNVVPIDRLWISGEFIPIKQPAYSYEFNRGYRKIYIPDSDKMRFISNVPGYMYSGYEQLPWFGELLIITKSHKDVMTFHELGYTAISPQGEGHKIDVPFMTMLQKRFKKIIINYDNDKAGILNSEQICQTFGITSLLIPEFKDLSDYTKYYGKEVTRLKLKEWLDTL